MAFALATRPLFLCKNILLSTLKDVTNIREMQRNSTLYFVDLANIEQSGFIEEMLYTTFMLKTCLQTRMEAFELACSVGVAL